MIRPLLLFVTLSACGAAAKKPPPGPLGDFVKNPVRTDPCVNDLFVIDLPLEADARQAPRDFAARLTAQLTATARANRGWFCDPGRCGPLDAPDALAARVERLLDPRPGLEPERFHRVAFYYRPEGASKLPWANARRLIVRDGAACDAVAGVRAAVDAVFGRRSPFYVARACTASGQQITRPDLTPRDDADFGDLVPDISPRMLDWHLQQIGVERPSDDRAPIVLVDTGVRADLIDGVEAVDPPAEVLPAAFDDRGRPVSRRPAVRHPHGTEMAAAMRQITRAPIRDLAVLGVDGRVPLGQVARAVDAAAAALGDDGAVINLSLGWAPEIERQRKLIRGACTTIEQPAGEAMRAVLARIHGEQTGVLVVAAAGNRAWLGEAYRQTFAARFDASVFGDARETDAFYPAQWGLRPSPIDNARRPTVLAVGANRSTGEPAAMDHRQASLYAPGQHVYVTGDGDAAPECSAGGEQGVSFPRPITGSSVAAALTSALAVRIVDRHPRLKARDLARLLYLAGVPIGVERDGRLTPHQGLHRLPARRLHAGRLDRLLRDPEPALEACAGQSPALTGAAPTAACVEALEARGLDERLTGPTPAITWPRTREPVCGSETVEARLRVRPSAVAVCEGATPPPGCRIADLYSAGDAGPQPETDGCDDCSLQVNIAEQLGRIQGILSPGYPEGTLITNPWLVAYWSTGEKVMVDLSDVDQVWGPGKMLDIAGLKLELGGLDLTKADVFLSLNVKTPGQTSASNDMSPLRVGED